MKGRRNENGQGEPQLTVSCDKISTNAMKEKGTIERSLVAVSSPPGTLSPGAAQEEYVWAGKTRRSEDTTARDSQLIAFLVAEFVVSNF